MNFKRKPLTQPQPFDVSMLENEITDLVTRDYAPPFDERKRPEPPTVEDIGLVTADAVKAQHEALAKTVEAMREPVAEWATYCQQAIADLEAAMKYIDETAQRCRAVGQDSHDRITRSSAVITEVRATCDAVRSKLNGDTPNAS